MKDKLWMYEELERLRKKCSPANSLYISERDYDISISKIELLEKILEI